MEALVLVISGLLQQMSAIRSSRSPKGHICFCLKIHCHGDSKGCISFALLQLQLPVQAWRTEI